MKHKHHIVPKHMNGSNDPQNIIELSIEEHANAHKVLYEMHGKLEDYLAWKGLTGQISRADLLIELYRQNGKIQGKKNKGKTAWNRGLSMTEEQKQKLRKPKSEEHKQKLKKPKQDTSKMGKYERTDSIKLKLKIANKNQFDTAESRKIHSEKIKSVRSKCVHCGLETVTGNINRWHNDKCKFKPEFAIVF